MPSPRRPWPPAPTFATTPPPCKSGRVTGVIGESKEGYVKVNASKGVIMCTGDTSDDEEMLEAYRPIMLGVQSMHAPPATPATATRWRCGPARPWTRRPIP